ncbi:uncharacterized protein EI90DRAFT_3045175 [Cantharellus anzutake]|uniref:uncharacterized protein n=1 Tax=Cantharellus anzutake TaxID=1750568 RepID=UPI0019032969|nr:uncharacterized protein EI90DRAFT_3045175 [Cantharellus anzutake]KAF8336291.1 hypothetical protein EI90DRAFT_3045175 [Cantharellus anzutake]
MSPANSSRISVDSLPPTPDRDRPPPLILQPHDLPDIDLATPTTGNEPVSALDTTPRPAPDAPVFNDPFVASSNRQLKPPGWGPEATKSPSRKTSLVSLLRKKSSQNSMKPKGSPASRRGSLASSDGGSVRERQGLEHIPDNSPPPASLVMSPTTISLPSSAYLSAPSKDSDNISLRSNVSTSGKKKGLRGWSSPKKASGPAGGIAGALASSGMSLATHATGGQNSPPIPRPLPGSKPIKGATPMRNGTKHATRTSIDNVLARSAPGLSSPPRSSEEPDGYPGELSDELYESPDGFSFDDDDIPVTGFAVASSKRNADFHDLFPDVPGNDYLIEDYGCALQRDILVQGRLYISENHMCFHANIFGWVTNVTIPFGDVTSLEKKMTAFVIPNAIQVTTRNAKYTFASFITRDTSYDVIQNIWRLSSPQGGGGLQHGEKVSLRSAVGNDSFIAPEDAPSATGRDGDFGERKHKATQCACLRQGQHLSETMMNCVMPGTPEQIQNLIWTSGFMRDFMSNNQKLTDIQSSEWSPQSTGSHLLSRTMTYTKPLNNNLGPKSTKCEITNEFLYADPNDYYTTLTTARTPGVPSGNVFSVKTRTCLMWAGSCSTNVIVTSMVEWTGRSFIKSMIEKGAMEGQRSYHVDLEAAMRGYIQEHKTEFFPEGEPEEAAVAEMTSLQIPAAQEAPLTPEEARKARQLETPAKGLQWALDTFTGAWSVGVKSASGAFEILCDIFENTSRPTLVTVVIVALVLSNIWTLAKFQNARYEQVAVKRRHFGSPYDGTGLENENLKAEALRVLLEGVISRSGPETPLHPPAPPPPPPPLSSSAALSPPKPRTPVGAESSSSEDLKSLQEALAEIEKRVEELKVQLSKLDEEIINS